jgi:hypothetical protein
MDAFQKLMTGMMGMAAGQGKTSEKVPGKATQGK